MDTLFGNAVMSVQMGVEDYQSNDSRRSLSAVRNFYAGVLLLAKEVLIRQVPDADPRNVLSSRMKPVPDGQGGVRYVPAGNQTIDFATIGERFRDFGLSIDQAALKELSAVRNDIEHYFTNKPSSAIRDAIARAFPVVVTLVRQIGEEPSAAFGSAWATMLAVRGVYEKELAECQSSFDKVDWKFTSLAAAPLICPSCRSLLVEQNDPQNPDHQLVDSHCRACGTEISAEDVIVAALEDHFDRELHEAMKGASDPPVDHCPECGVVAYLTIDDDNGCAYCGFLLEGECARCSTGLTPQNVSADTTLLCSYCDYVMSKDD